MPLLSPAQFTQVRARSVLHTLLLLICFALAGRVAAARSSDSADSLNPIVVQGTFVDSAHVLLSLGGFAAIASTSDPFNRWADTVGVWYSDTGFPASRAGNAFKFSLGALKQAGEPYTVTVSLPALGAGPSSFYYFVGTVFWHNPDTIARFIARQGAQVLMLDTTALPISLKLPDAVYSSADTTLTVLVTNSKKPVRRSTVYWTVLRQPLRCPHDCFLLLPARYP